MSARRPRLAGERAPQRSARVVDAWGAVPGRKLERDHAGDQRRWKELANDRLEIGEAAGERMCRDDVAEAGSGERHEAEVQRSEEHTSELQSPCNLVCRLLLEKKKGVYLHVPGGFVRRRRRTSGGLGL